jgi:PKD repeat protein
MITTMGLLFAMAVMAPVVAAQGEPPPLEWSEDVLLSESTEISDDPNVALTPDGGMVIVWRERLVGRYSVFFALLNEEGHMIGERQQLGENLSASMDPAIAVDSRGRLHFVWTALEDQELWYARAAPNGRIENGPLRLTEAAGDSAEASVWMDRRDHLHIVWFDGRGGLAWLYYMQLDQDGDKVIEDTELVQTISEQESAIAMDSAGDLHIAWNSIAPPSQLQWNGELHYTKISSQGDVLVRDRLVATARGSIGFPDIAIDLRDHVHLVWPEGTGPREQINYAELDSSGRTHTGPIEISSTGMQAARDVAIAVDGNDRLHTVWAEGLTGAADLVYAMMARGGEVVEGPTMLTDAIGDSRDPEMGLSPRGEPRVVWSDRRSGNPEIYLKVATRPNEGVDLAVSSRDITFDPPTPVANEAAELRVEVHNHGDSRSPESMLQVLVDTSLLGQVNVKALDPGESVLLHTDVTFDEGEHSISVMVDPFNEIDETIESNNGASIAIRVYPAGTLEADAGPDLATTAGTVTYLDATDTVYLGTGVLSYEWDFGDGTDVGYGLYVEHVYQEEGTYQVTLRVSDGTIEDTDTARVEVAPRNDPPVAVIDQVGPLTADRINPLALSASGSTDDVGIDEFSWDMGDGTVITGVTVSHTYGSLGIYVIELTVTDGGGLIDVNKTTVDVNNLLPEVTLLEAPNSTKVGKGETFAVEVEDPDGTISEVGWDFDASDGISFQVRAEAVDWTFKKPGTYNVTCIVRDDDGGQTAFHISVDVKEDSGSSSIPFLGSGWTILILVTYTLLAIALKTRAQPQKAYQSRFYRIPKICRRDYRR